MRTVKLVVACVLLAGCGDNHKSSFDGGADTVTDTHTLLDGNPLEPETLAGTGLCVDAACTQLSSDVYAYTPRWPLWADAASKRRWVYLPPGTQIDTSDMDHWKFPLGTKFWKEFTSGSTRVETRYIVKVGPGDTTADWFYVAYAWNATQDATTAVPFGVVDANGTTHDIPSRTNCKRCHENLKPTRILGFGALQLDFHNPTAGELDLDALVAANVLTVPPAGAATPHYALPSDGTTGAQEALGYLHANCGHCHNPTSDVYVSNGITMFLREDVGTLGSVTQTPPYMTAVDQDAMHLEGGLTKIITRGDPDHSIMILRFESTDGTLRMPPVSVETTDPTGDATLRTWITNL
jgi:hypothetical protein